ncbi:MAG: carboxyl transferase domain-containing protein, partial [Actinomycetota bacterium]
MGRNDEKPSRSISSDPTSDLAAPCPACGAELSPLPQAPGFCPQCGHHRPLPGRAWFDLLADPGSIAEFDPHLRSGDPLGFWTAAGSYAADLTRVREKSGEQESVVCAEAGIDGIPLVVVALSFAHFGGSVGAGAGEKIARAFERATALRRPILVVTASGGARMQEGMIALLQLPKIVLAAREHAGAGLISIAVLTSPTTGGVYVSLSALADVVLAESGATIGFAGPRV